MGNKRTKARAQAVPLTDQPVNWSRLRQTFGSMSHRGTPVLRGHVLSGIVVDAETPEEMVEKTDQALVDKVKDEPEN